MLLGRKEDNRRIGKREEEIENSQEKRVRNCWIFKLKFLNRNQILCKKILKLMR